MSVDKKTRVGLRVCIYQRGKKGIYVADFHHDGRHCRKSLATSSKKLATQKATAIEYELMNGSFKPNVTRKEQGIDMPKITIEQVCRDYIAYLKTEGRRRKTVVKYKGILCVFTQFAHEYGITEINRVDLVLVDKYRAKRQPQLSAKSMHHEGSLLKRLFTWCLERHLVTSNPLADCTFRAPKAKPRGGPTLKQINDILKVSSKTRHPVLSVAAFAGMRIGEIARLRVKDVDLIGNWIHVVSRPDYETKSGESWKIPIHPRLRKTLEQIPRKKEGWFFNALPSRKYPRGDHHINPKHVNEDLIRILNELDIPSGRESGFTLHSLRSSFKTICINSGVPKEAVDVWQNHAPDRAASHVYYRLTDEESQRLIRFAQFGDQ